MHWLKATIPMMLAALIVGTLWLGVRYYDAYAAPGIHWAPASPIAGELASFRTELAQPGVYRVTVEKLSSKLPLLFVEYQAPGPLLDTRMQLSDGQLRLKLRFADEGQYRIRAWQAHAAAGAPPVFEHGFAVQTPLARYVVNAILVVVLLIAGYASGRQLRQLHQSRRSAAGGLTNILLIVISLIVISLGVAVPVTPSHAHGTAPASAATGDNSSGLSLEFVHPEQRNGYANSAPLLWDIRVLQAGVPLDHTAFDLEVIHGESRQTVLALAGITPGDHLPLRYAPPDGTHYEIALRIMRAQKTDGAPSPMGSRRGAQATDGLVALSLAHVSAVTQTEAKAPTTARQWQSFILLMLPALVGMAWGYGKKPTANATILRRT